MKKLIFILAGILVVGQLTAQDILPKPNPPRLVNDAANALSPEQKEILEHKLVLLDDSSSNQVAIVLIKSLNDYPIEEYANKLFREWGIGHKKTNNGVLILAAINDRKIRIEVGYGLEGAIPDITTASIIRNDIVPAFGEGNYYRGLDKAITSIAKAAVGEYKVKRDRKKGRGGKSSFLLAAIVVFAVLALASRGGGRRGGGLVSRRGYGDIAETVFWTSLLGGGGRGGGGSDWGGGGGGFGGFGGGSGGGGGASGSW